MIQDRDVARPELTQQRVCSAPHSSLASHVLVSEPGGDERNGSSSIGASTFEESDGSAQRRDGNSRQRSRRRGGMQRRGALIFRRHERPGNL
jgi:hypothetical protein